MNAAHLCLMLLPLQGVFLVSAAYPGRDLGYEFIAPSGRCITVL